MGASCSSIDRQTGEIVDVAALLLVLMMVRVFAAATASDFWLVLERDYAYSPHSTAPLHSPPGRQRLEEEQDTQPQDEGSGAQVTPQAVPARRRGLLLLVVVVLIGGLRG